MAIARAILRYQKASSIMWPIMTLTLLLQLTDDEQLFAQRMEPVIYQPTPQQTAPAVPADPTPAATWPQMAETAC